MYAPLTSLLVPQQAMFEIVFMDLFALKTNIQHCVSEELHHVHWSVFLQVDVCLKVCGVCVPAVREHDQWAAEAVHLWGTIPARAGWVSAGGHCHGDPTLPWQPASRSGFLSSGTVGFWFRPVQFSLVFHDVIQHCKSTQNFVKSLQITWLNEIHSFITFFKLRNGFNKLLLPFFFIEIPFDSQTASYPLYPHPSHFFCLYSIIAKMAKKIKHKNI